MKHRDAAGAAPAATTDAGNDARPLAAPADRQRPAFAASGLHYFGLLLFALCFYIGVISVAMASSQYVYARYAADAGIPDAGRSSDTSRCKGASNATLELRRRAAVAQERSSQLSLYSSLASGLPSLLSVFLLSAFSDRWGRKASMLVPWATTLLSFLVISLIVLLDLAVEWTVLAAFVSGLGGSFASLLASVFATVADITTGRNRAMYIGISEAVLTASFSVSELAVGVWIRARGYKEPIVAFSCLMAFSIVPFICLVPETAPAVGRREPLTARRFRGLLAASFGVFSSDWRRAKKLIALVLAFFFLSLNFMAFQVNTLYVLGLPFCWNSERLGYFLAASAVADQVVLVAVLSLLRSRVSDSFLALVGLGSDVGRGCVYGVAFLFSPPFDDIALYSSRVVGLLSKLPATMLRTMTSKSVSPTEQGAAFGVIAFVQVLSSLFAGTVTNGIYSSTVAAFPGFVFFVLAGFAAVSAGFVGAYSQLNRRHQQQQQEQLSLDVNADSEEAESASDSGGRNE